MPASPSENQTKWRKRKRDSQISRRHQKHEEEDDEENPNVAEEDHAERDYDSKDQTYQNHPNSQPHVETEVLSDHDVQILQFPVVIKRSVNRPHSSVTAIVALERALESGDNKAQSALDAPILENVSHGQLQALWSVPSDNFVLDDIVAAAVLSGNRNFEGRVHPLTRANYLASPPLVVAYALAGTVDIDFEKEPIGTRKDGNID